MSIAVPCVTFGQKNFPSVILYNLPDCFCRYLRVKIEGCSGFWRFSMNLPGRAWPSTWPGIWTRRLSWNGWRNCLSHEVCLTISAVITAQSLRRKTSVAGCRWSVWWPCKSPELPPGRMAISSLLMENWGMICSTWRSSIRFLTVES